MVYSLLGCQSLVLIHLHQTCNQTLSCQRKIHRRRSTKRRLFSWRMGTQTWHVFDRGRGKKEGNQRHLKCLQSKLPLCASTVLTLSSAHLSQRFRPSTESRTRNRLPGSSGTGSCRGFRNHRHRFHRRTEGCLTAWISRKKRRASKKANGKNVIMNLKMSVYPLSEVIICLESFISSLQDLRHHLQYVHDDTCRPAVHRPAIPLSANHLWSCTTTQDASSFLAVTSQLICLLNSILCISSPRYSGVPQGSLISPFSSLARWKSLMTILECFRRL